jgi:hypothetical protein
MRCSYRTPETTAASQVAEDAHRGIFRIAKPTGIYATGETGVVVEPVLNAWIAGKQELILDEPLQLRHAA